MGAEDHNDNVELGEAEDNYGSVEKDNDSGSGGSSTMIIVIVVVIVCVCLLGLLGLLGLICCCRSNNNNGYEPTINALDQNPPANPSADDAKQFAEWMYSYYGWNCANTWTDENTDRLIVDTVNGLESQFNYCRTGNYSGNSGLKGQTTAAKAAMDLICADKTNAYVTTNQPAQAVRYYNSAGDNTGSTSDNKITWDFYYTPGYQSLDKTTGDLGFNGATLAYALGAALIGQSASGTQKVQAGLDGLNLANNDVAGSTPLTLLEQYWTAYFDTYYAQQLICNKDNVTNNGSDADKLALSYARIYCGSTTSATDDGNDCIDRRNDVQALLEAQLRLLPSGTTDTVSDQLLTIWNTLDADSTFAFFTKLEACYTTGSDDSNKTNEIAKMKAEFINPNSTYYSVQPTFTTSGTYIYEVTSLNPYNISVAQTGGAANKNCKTYWKNTINNVSSASASVTANAQLDGSSVQTQNKSGISVTQAKVDPHTQRSSSSSTTTSTTTTTTGQTVITITCVPSVTGATPAQAEKCYVADNTTNTASTSIAMQISGSGADTQFYESFLPPVGVAPPATSRNPLEINDAWLNVAGRTCSSNCKILVQSYMSAPKTVATTFNAVFAALNIASTRVTDLEFTVGGSAVFTTGSNFGAQMKTIKVGSSLAGSALPTGTTYTFDTLGSAANSMNNTIQIGHNGATTDTTKFNKDLTISVYQEPYRVTVYGESVDALATAGTPVKVLQYNSQLEVYMNMGEYDRSGTTVPGTAGYVPTKNTYVQVNNPIPGDNTGNTTGSKYNVCVLPSSAGAGLGYAYPTAALSQSGAGANTLPAECTSAAAGGNTNSTNLSFLFPQVTDLPNVVLRNDSYVAAGVTTEMTPFASFKTAATTNAARPSSVQATTLTAVNFITTGFPAASTPAVVLANTNQAALAWVTATTA